MKTRTQQYIKGERFTWDIHTVEYYAVKYVELGLTAVALDILNYVREECSLEDGETWEMLYADLLEVVEVYYYLKLM